MVPHSLQRRRKPMPRSILSLCLRFNCFEHGAVRVSRFVRGFDRVPDLFKEPEQYLTEISAIVKRRNIDVLLPVHEDALAIQTYRQLLPENLLIACPPRTQLVRVLDKYEIIKIAASAKVAVPKTLAPAHLIELESCAQELGFPLIIKTRRGNSGKGVFRVNSLEETRQKYREVVDNFGLANNQLPILQEYAEGSVFGSCFLAKDGEVKACFVNATCAAKKQDLAPAYCANRANFRCCSTIPKGWQKH
jgi:glutathione synthase/RimK-type ligase-like ATP-grasp enzyme